MSDRITLRGMQFAGVHGVSEEERAFPQVIEVDLEIETDLSRAADSDDLRDTINYGPLVEVCRAAVEDNSQRLLEGIAGTILARVLAETTAGAATVRVRKLAVPVDAEIASAEVELRRTRSDAPRQVASPDPARGGLLPSG
jgi:7,8-dihydroneopterin aldolase/epimerase/oxygenase